MPVWLHMADWMDFQYLIKCALWFQHYFCNSLDF